MADDISIWRWAVNEDIEALFARLMAADEAGFRQIAQQIEQQDEASAPSLEEIAAQSEAKYRAMGLPDDILTPMLAGLRTMVEEARAAQEIEEAQDALPDPGGRTGIALASSHMFHDDPFASLGYDAREAQVAALLAKYEAAITAAAGFAGQSLAQYLGIAQEAHGDEDVLDVLLEVQMADVVRVWPLEDQVFALTCWQEDRDLPVDIEFFRAPRALFDAVRERV